MFRHLRRFPGYGQGQQKQPQQRRHRGQSRIFPKLHSDSSFACPIYAAINRNMCPGATFCTQKPADAPHVCRFFKETNYFYCMIADTVSAVPCRRSLRHQAVIFHDEGPGGILSPGGIVLCHQIIAQFRPIL